MKALNYFKTYSKTTKSKQCGNGLKRDRSVEQKKKSKNKAVNTYLFEF